MQVFDDFLLTQRNYLELRSGGNADEVLCQSLLAGLRGLPALQRELMQMYSIMNAAIPKPTSAVVFGEVLCKARMHVSGNAKLEQMMTTDEVLCLQPMFQEGENLRTLKARLATALDTMLHGIEESPRRIYIVLLPAAWVFLAFAWREDSCRQP